jgi:aspartyl protease family protein
MARTYLVFLLVVGFLGSMLSGAGSRTHPVAEKTLDDHHSSVSQESPPAADPSADAIELQRQANGHFYADVQINGSTVHVLVDTGASGIALSRDDAQRAGLAVSAGMFNVIGEGADGDVHGEFVTLDRVSLGNTTAESVPAVILDAGEQSLLGQSFLSKFQAVEIKGDTMVLR